MNLNKKYPYFIVLLFIILTAACTKEYATIAEEDEQNIQAYISTNGLVMQKYDTTGVYYSVTQVGTGPDLDYTKQIPLVYSVKSLDGSYTSQDTFVNHYASYFGYFTPEVLKKTIMANLIKEGGTIRVIVPSHLAYGRNGSGPIPGNASLEYTVKVLERSKLKQYEKSVIKTYLSANGLTGFTEYDTTGIYYKISEAGTGTTPIGLDSSITFNYTGRLLNGTVFETNEAITTILGSYIPSWQTMIPLIKEGGSIRFIAPSSYSYGITGSAATTVGQVSIPPFAPLDFDVQVTTVAP
ncbi:FKBP-type peptidyl-prolyl cis-trans isomerase [Arcticibacter svalbardensis MN12-7]|uniref:Peptidyl-prolyl cis-trans isomerase n=1 Tax=Arcticibacter svalbardensis MN12-7 TaxID=1150600 RepID=R9GTE1_9SPHI|nr:FKBP-type peptidyl-prolyl cis-trans isomerase [Arcticibacter svalbardensis]EOR95117.1 FKBP-type peptidyl-prolyl cis-trans isomerase [Arcticibacter svalbardensis MN12-7]